MQAPNIRKYLAFIFFTLLLDVVGMAVIIPVIPQLIKDMLGSDISEASKYYAFLQFLFSPIRGGLSDRYGRRPVLLISLLGMGINYLFLVFAPTLGWLFLGRAFSGIAGASITTASAFIADISTPDKRSQNFGLIGVAFGLGFIVGPLIGGLVADFSPRAPFMVSAILAFANFAYGWFALPESLDASLRRPFSWKRANPVGSFIALKNNPVVSSLAISLTLIYLGAHAVQSTWSYYTMYKFDWDEQHVGISLGVVGGLIMLVQGVIIRWTIKKWGPANSVIVGLILYVIGLVLFGLANEGWMMYVFSIVYCLGGIAGPNLQGMMSNSTAPNKQGELQGALSGLMSITAIFGPLLMLNLFNQFSGKKAIMDLPGLPFFVGALLMAFALIFAIPFLKANKKPKKDV
jgi:DHA1 family tetracycline resistance protein-like MFS transporter